jgi:hypothetical protein
MSQKISNHLLLEIISFGTDDISASLADCASHLGLKGPTVATWHRNFKTGKWPKNYSKTEDQQPLRPELVEKFIKSFIFSGHASKILKRLVSAKCLRNKQCFMKQHKILKRLFKKYPTLDFWLNMDFGEPKDDILLFTGKAEKYLRKKYLDFSAVDGYTPFEYTFNEPISDRPRRKRHKSLWDYYEE